MKTPSSRCIRVVITATVFLLGTASRLFGHEAAHWNQIAIETTTRALPQDPISESRILAIMHLAMHDAANTAEPRFRTYSPASTENRGGSVDVAIAAAAHATLSELLPQHRSELDAELDRRIREIPESATKARGLAAGRTAAQWLLEQRKNDGARNTSPYAAGTRPGAYRPTPPDFTPAVASHWGKVRPFAMSSAQQFRPAPPPAIGSELARADLDEVRAIGGADSQLRSHEQSEIACYWYEHSTRGWNRIAHEVGIARKLDVWQYARLLALVHVAMADGFIGGFEAKYHYNYWRPATAVRESGRGQWLSYLITPPVPDYPSTHTVLGAAAATVLARCLGTDFVCFSMTSGEPYPNITRRFWSFSEAARENGASRVFAGLHFSTAVDAGYRQGAEIGAWAVDHALRPLDNDRLIAASGE